MAQNYSKEYNEGPVGGCKAKDVHDEMRKDDVEIGGEERSTKELLRPQTGEPDGFDG